jgi:hypothetical protein
MSVAALAKERRIGGDEHAFHQGAVAQAPEKFLRRILCALFADQLDRLQGELFREFLAQCPGQVAHGLPGHRPPCMQPVEHLVHPVGGLVPRLQQREQVVAGGFTDVRQHARRLRRVIAKPKPELQRPLGRGAP